MTTTDIRLHYRGCYRVTLSVDRFGQITKRGREWHAEIRNSETGSLVQFAGIWNSRRDAINELRSTRI